MRPGTLLPTGVAAKVRNGPHFSHRVRFAGHCAVDGVHLFCGHTYHVGEAVQDSQQDDRFAPNCWR